MKINLNGKWQLRNTKKQSFILADVPGDIFLAHLENRLIPDPFYGKNEKDAYKLAEHDYEYIKKFNVTQGFLQRDSITLVAEQIDTVAQIFINDTLVKEVENAHILHRIEVKKHLVEGENTLKIIFYSPLKYIQKHNADDSMPLTIGQEAGVAHIRKPQCHFGWDWGINLPIMGITRDIYLESHNKGRISGINISQLHTRQNDKPKVELDIDVDVAILDGVQDFTVEVKVISPDGNIIEVKKSKQTEFKFEILQPELWWTRELNGKDSQPLYKVQAAIYHNGDLCDKMSKRIGLRTIELVTDKDKYGSNFQFVLNGVPLFIKGVNFIPPDAMITRAEDKLEYYIDSMLEANMNMVRIWGGGYYLSDTFYDYCDTKGLLVWQDFAFACAPYPFYKQSFLDNVLAEVASNVGRLKHHACLAAWCGNNEIELMTIGWLHRIKLVSWTKKFFYDILPTNLRKLDKTTPYMPSSPTSFEFLSKVNSEDYGSKHIWSVWHGLRPIQHYRKLYPRFAAEFGMQSMPSLDMIADFAEKKDYSLDSEVMKSHQKCLDGNDKMLFYMAGELPISNKFEDLPYLTQLSQASAISHAVEHMRINRGRCNGSIYWQLNDCWGVSSWASIDYMGKYKALQYAAAKFYAPVTIALEKHKKHVNIYVINDLPNEQNIKVEYGIMDFSGKHIIKEYTPNTAINILSVNKVCRIDTSFLDNRTKRSYVLYAKLYVDSELVVQKTLCFAKDKHLGLSDADVSYTINQEVDGISIELKSSCFARQVAVDISGVSNPFSDNYFDLLPNESKKIYIKTAQDIDKDKLEIKCVNNIKDIKPLYAGLLLRAKVRLKPINLASAFFYLFNK